MICSTKNKLVQLVVFKFPEVKVLDAADAKNKFGKLGI